MTASPQTQEDKTTELLLDHVYRGMLLRALSDHYLIVKFDVDIHRAKRLADAGLLECRTDGHYQKEYVPTKAAKDMLA